MSGRLQNKVAVITGGASGIGATTAKRFLDEGCKVVIGDLKDSLSASDLSSKGQSIVFQQCDVTSERDVENLVNLAVDTFGSLDVMFNNAGIVGAIGPISSTPVDEWQYTLDVLLNGVFYGIKHASKVMIPKRSGSIISMSSVAGLMGGLGPHAYATAKHAVVGLTKNVATELCGYGIRVNAIAPYSMATPMVAQAFLQDHTAIDKARDMLAKESPLVGRPGTAEDVANAALWLASDESGYTTGHVLTTDAGITIGAVSGPPKFSEHMPIQRERGKSGL